MKPPNGIDKKTNAGARHLKVSAESNALSNGVFDVFGESSPAKAKIDNASNPGTVIAKLMAKRKQSASTPDKRSSGPKQEVALLNSPTSDRSKKRKIIGSESAISIKESDWQIPISWIATAGVVVRSDQNEGELTLVLSSKSGQIHCCSHRHSLAASLPSLAFDPKTVSHVLGHKYISFSDSRIRLLFKNDNDGKNVIDLVVGTRTHCKSLLSKLYQLSNPLEIVEYVHLVT